MNPEFSIGEAQVEDVEGIRKVQRDTWISTYPNKDAGISEEDIVAKIEELQTGGAERLKDRLENDRDRSHTWVARVDDQVVGFVGAQRTEEANKLRAIYVLPGFQGHGIGHQLLQSALDWLGREKPISLSVVAYNQNAINFYRSHGFIEKGPVVSELDHLKSGAVLPEVEMILEPATV